MDIEWQGKPINFRAFCREQKKLNKLVTGEQNQTRYAVLLDSDLTDEFNSSNTDKGRVPLVLLTQSMADKSLGLVCLNENLKTTRYKGSGKRLVDCRSEEKKLIQQLGKVLTRKRLLSMNPEFALARAIAAEDGALCKALISDRPDLLSVSAELLELFGDYSQRLPEVVVRHFHEACADWGDVQDILENRRNLKGNIQSIIRGAYHLMSRRPKIEAEVREILSHDSQARDVKELMSELIKSGRCLLVKKLLQEGWITRKELFAHLVYESGHKGLITEAVRKGISVEPQCFEAASPEIIEWAVGSRWGKAFGLESNFEKYWNGIDSKAMSYGGNILAWAASVEPDEERLKKILCICSMWQDKEFFPMFDEEIEYGCLLSIKKQVIGRLVDVVGEEAYLRWLQKERLSRGVVKGCEIFHVEMLSRLVRDEDRREILDGLVRDLGLCFIHQQPALRDDLSERVSKMMPHDSGAVYGEMLRFVYRGMTHRQQENEILTQYIDRCPEDGERVKRLSSDLGDLDGMPLSSLIDRREGGRLYGVHQLKKVFHEHQSKENALKLGRFLQKNDPSLFSALLANLCSESCYPYYGWKNLKVVLTLVRTEQELSKIPVVVDGIKNAGLLDAKKTAGEIVYAMKEAGCEVMFQRVVQDYRKENSAEWEDSVLCKVEELMGETAPIAGAVESGEGFSCG